VSTRAQCPERFSNDTFLIIDMFQYLCAKNRVETVILKRQIIYLADHIHAIFITLNDIATGLRRRARIVPFFIRLVTATQVEQIALYIFIDRLFDIPKQKIQVDVEVMFFSDPDRTQTGKIFFAERVAVHAGLYHCNFENRMLSSRCRQTSEHQQVSPGRLLHRKSGWVCLHPERDLMPDRESTKKIFNQQMAGKLVKK